MGKLTRHADFWNRPMAAEGLTSYRYKGRYGWIMLGARDNEDALVQAARSTKDPIDARNLQVWNGESYEPT